MGMKVLFTPMNINYVFGICDIATGKVEMIETPMIIDDHRPFGVTWCRGRVFLAQPTSIWEFDSRLNFKKVLVRDLWYGLHQMTCFEKALWVVSPRLNGIQRFNLDGEARGIFFPSKEGVYGLPESFRGKDKLTYQEDISHYNSIMFHDGMIYLTAHNHDKPSKIEIFNKNLKLVRTLSKIGRQAHNVLIDDGIWWIDSLGERSLVCEDGRKVKIGGDGDFVRGLAGTQDYFFTAKFPYCEKRTGRRQGDAELVVINRGSLKVENRIKLAGVGNINDLRIMDETDLGHNVSPLTEVAIY